MNNAFSCPHCGADVAETAKFCRECGSDDETGWKDDFTADQGYEEGDDFDYDDFLRREFPDQAPATPTTSKSLAFVVIVVLLLLSMLLFAM